MPTALGALQDELVAKRRGTFRSRIAERRPFERREIEARRIAFDVSEIGDNSHEQPATHGIALWR